MALSADSTSSGSTVRRLLDAFRQQWAAGTPPEIEEVLREVGNGSSVSLLASLIEVEVQHRIQAGEAPGVDEYIARFPNDSATVRAAFTALSEVTRIADVVGSVPPRELPRQLGKYRVVRLLGAGSFGSVYLARDPDLQRDVAIKVLRPQPDDADSVMTEAQNAAALRHPAIVTIYSIERSGDSWYIIQEYVAGCTLREAIARGEPASIDDRVALLKSVADAVAHAVAV